MFSYQKNALEDWVQQFYEFLNIDKPYQLDMIDICSKLNIWIYFEDMASKAIERKGHYSMVIDRRLSAQEQWQDFGHELCHLLRQAGNQFLLPKQFVQFQETKADNFAREFCIPSFMLLKLSLPQSRREAIRVVADTFQTTDEFAEKRLVQLEQRLITSQLQDQFAASMEADWTYRQKLGCDYVLESRTGTALFNRKAGFIGCIKHRGEWGI